MVDAAKTVKKSKIMVIASIREALHRQPFQPFVIRLADGRSLPVLHPDFVALGKRRIIVVEKDDTTSMAEPLPIHCFACYNSEEEQARRRKTATR
jgi:hypothetical protein